jgi:hypothetical protein
VWGPGIAEAMGADVLCTSFLVRSSLRMALSRLERDIRGQRNSCRVAARRRLDSSFESRPIGAAAAALTASLSAHIIALAMLAYLDGESRVRSGSASAARDEVALGVRHSSEGRVERSTVAARSRRRMVIGGA